MTQLKQIALGMFLALPTYAPIISTCNACAAQTSTPGLSRTPILIPRSHEERERNYLRQRRIAIDVQITDNSGNPVRHLVASSFIILRDGSSQQLASFREVDAQKSAIPAGVIILLDSVNNPSRTISDDRRAIEKFIRQSPSHLEHPTSVGILSESGVTLGDPVQNRDLLLDQFENIKRHLHGLSCADEENPNQAFLEIMRHGDAPTTTTSARQLACLNQRFVTSLLGLENIGARLQETPGRAIVIWIGAGWPLLYNTEFRPDNERMQLDWYEDLATLSETLREADVTLDMVSPGSIFRKTPHLNEHDTAFIDGVSNPREATAGTLSLQALANQSGGQVFLDAKSTTQAIAECISDAESYYVLSFDSPPALQPKEYHSLEVKVGLPGVKVRTRKLYYADDWSPQN